jgi:hypothetical protein
MKIRRKQALGPKEPLRHPDHPRPVTRREFLGQGLLPAASRWRAFPRSACLQIRVRPTQPCRPTSRSLLPVSQGGLCDIVGRGMIPFML